MTTKIQWADQTWNPTVGCTRVSAGCDNCYAVPMTHRLASMSEGTREGDRRRNYVGLTVLNARDERHFNGVVRCVPEALPIPLSWRKPQRIFVNSMSDLFHREVPFEFLDRVFAVMGLCDEHTFMVLTKRPSRMAEYLGTPGRHGLIADAAGDLQRDGVLPDHWCFPDGMIEDLGWPFQNVWLGTSVEDQEAWEDRVRHLVRCPAAVRFLSCEPLIDEVVLGLRHLQVCCRCSGYQYVPGQCGYCGSRVSRRRVVQWVIVGGESGPGARPCVIGWIRSIVRECVEAGVAVFVKQLGSRPCNREGEPHAVTGKGDNMDEWPPDLCFEQFPQSDRIA